MYCIYMFFEDNQIYFLSKWEIYFTTLPKKLSKVYKACFCILKSFVVLKAHFFFNLSFLEHIRWTMIIQFKNFIVKSINVNFAQILNKNYLWHFQIPFILTLRLSIKRKYFKTIIFIEKTFFKSFLFYFML